jgi:hypothetical protein
MDRLSMQNKYFAGWFARAAVFARRHLHFFSLITYLCLLLFGSIAFVVSMRQMGLVSMRHELSLMAETTRMRLANMVNSELALALRILQFYLLLKLMYGII